MGVRLLYFLNLLVAVLLIVVAVVYYIQLPERVPVHFSASGVPDRWGSKSELLLLPVAFVLCHMMVLAIMKNVAKYGHWTRYRFRDLLANIRNENLRKYYEDKLTEAGLLFSLLVGTSLLAMEVIAFELVLNYVKYGKTLINPALIVLPITILPLGAFSAFYKVSKKLIKCAIENICEEV